MGTVYRTLQSTRGSEGVPSAPPAGLGAPGLQTILLLSKTDKMPIFDRELDRLSCIAIVQLWHELKIVLFKGIRAP